MTFGDGHPEDICSLLAFYFFPSSHLVPIVVRLMFCTVLLRSLSVRIYALSVTFVIPVSIPQISLKIELRIGISESSSITFGDDRDEDFNLGSNL